MSTILEKHRDVIMDLAASYSLEVGDAQYDKECFGNSSVLLSGRSLSFRAILERSEAFLDYRLEGGEWIDTRVVLERIGKLERAAMPGLEQLIKLVVEHREAFLRMIA